MHEPGTVVFFLYFPNRERAEHAHALLDADGFAAQQALPPDNPKEDSWWSLSAEQAVAFDGVDAAVARVREIAAVASGELDAISMPWPAHPAAFASRRAPRS